MKDIAESNANAKKQNGMSLKKFLRSREEFFFISKVPRGVDFNQRAKGKLLFTFSPGVTYRKPRAS